MRVSGPSLDPAGRALPAWLPIVLVGLVFAAHAPALRAGWVLDDHVLVAHDTAVQQGPSGIREVLARDAWKGEADAGVWRPLPLVTFCLEAPLWRGEHGALDPFGFHLTNLLLHATCAVLLLLLLWRALPSRPVLAAGAAIVFAVHPMHVGTVSQIAGRADLLALLFCLLTALLWRRERTTLVPLAVLTYFLALLSKETALALPLVLLAVHGPRLALAVFALPCLVWGFVWHVAGMGLAENLGPAVEGLGRAALGLVIPVGFVRDRLALTNGLEELAPVAAGWAVGLLVVGVAVLLLVRPRRAVGLGLAATVVMVLVGAIVAPQGAPLEIRFAYVTGAGLFVVAGALVESLVLGARRPVRLAGAAALVLLVVGLGGLSWTEARTWADEGVFLDGLMERYPGRSQLYLRKARGIRTDVSLQRAFLARQRLSGLAQTELARTSRRRLDEAEALAMAAARHAAAGGEVSRAAAAAWREVGLVQFEGARAAEAALSLREALRVDPVLVDTKAYATMSPADAKRVSETYAALSRAEESTGRTREAAAHLEAALQFRPDDTDLQRRTARGLMRAGRYGRGMRLLEETLASDLEADERIAVEEEYREAQRAAHAAADRHLKAGRVAQRDGNDRDAIGEFELALEADPTLLDAWLRLIHLRGVMFGQCAQAYRLLDQARGAMDRRGLARDDPWRGKLAKLRMQVDEVCKEEDEKED